jgi:hypothetical protein
MTRRGEEKEGTVNFIIVINVLLVCLDELLATDNSDVWKESKGREGRRGKDQQRTI